MGTVPYAEAREKLASLWNEVVSTRKAVVIKRRGHPDIAMLPADELSSLMEAAHLLRSPANVRRLLGALKRAQASKGRAMTMDDLRNKSGVKSRKRSGESPAMPVSLLSRLAFLREGEAEGLRQRSSLCHSAENEAPVCRAGVRRSGETA